MERSLEILSPAKLNIFLQIPGRLRSGYHLLRSLACPLSLVDRMRITLRPVSAGVRCTCVLAPKLAAHVAACREKDADVDDVLVELSGPKNLAARAVTLLLDESGRVADTGVSIEIEKSVPFGAGLGGGSSNAAAALVGLNQLLGTGFTTSQLCALGEKLGSDLPVTIAGRLIFMHGTGNLLSEVEGLEVEECQTRPDLSGARLVIIKPLTRVNTGKAYASLGFEPSMSNELTEFDPIAPDSLASQSLAALGFKLADKRPNASGQIKAAEPLTFSSQAGSSGQHAAPVGSPGFGRAIFNDFERVVIPAYPELQDAKSLLTQLGAWHVSLAGSGSCLVGWFASEAAAIEAGKRAEHLKRPGWLVEECRLKL